MYGHVADAQVIAEGSSGPVGFSGRGLVEGRMHDLPHDGGGDRLRCPSRGVSANTVDAKQGEPSPPSADGDGISSELLDDRLVGHSLGGAEDDLRAKDEALLGGTAPGPLLELSSFLGGEHDRLGDPHTAGYTVPDIMLLK
jgi:hypothetical protein